MVRRDGLTIDLFRDYQPKPVVERFSDEQVQAWSMAGRLAKALALTMDESALSRSEIAEQMSTITQSAISKTMLDAYASQAKESHQIPASRLVALVAVTGDARALNVLLEEIELIAIPRKYESLLRRERAREMRAQLEREEQAADAEWRAKK